jgi:hypothetical protein
MAKARAKNRRLERWQVLLAAAVTAVASVVVALLGLWGGGGPSPSPSASSSASSSVSQTVIAITSLSEQPLPPPPGKRYVFAGIARNLPSGQSLIFVIGAENNKASGPWLVSPYTAPSKDGRWTVHWDLPNPPAQVRWMAVVWFDNSCPPGSHCGGNPYPELEGSGPHAPHVVAVVTAPSSRR